jgi:hypothetical protein
MTLSHTQGKLICRRGRNNFRYSPGRLRDEVRILRQMLDESSSKDARSGEKKWDGRFMFAELA